MKLVMWIPPFIFAHLEVDLLIKTKYERSTRLTASHLQC